MVRKFITKLATKKHLEKIIQGLYLLLIPLGIGLYYPDWWIPLNDGLNLLGQPHIQVIKDSYDVVQQQAMFWRPEHLLRPWFLVGVLGIGVPGLMTLAFLWVKHWLGAYRKAGERCPIDDYLRHASLHLNLFGLGQVVRHLLLMVFIMFLPQLLFASSIKLPLDVAYSLLGAFLGYCFLVEGNFWWRGWHYKTRTAQVVDEHLGLKQALITYLSNSGQANSALQQYLYHQITKQLKKWPMKALFPHHLPHFSRRRLLEQFVLVNISAFLLSLTLSPLVSDYHQVILASVEAKELSENAEVVSPIPQLILEDEQLRQLAAERGTLTQEQEGEGIFIAKMDQSKLEAELAWANVSGNSRFQKTKEIKFLNKTESISESTQQTEQDLLSNQTSKNDRFEQPSISSQKDFLTPVNHPQKLTQSMKRLDRQQKVGTKEQKKSLSSGGEELNSPGASDVLAIKEELEIAMSNEIEEIVEGLRTWQEQLAQSVPGVRYDGSSQQEIFMGGEGSYLHPAKVIKGHNEREKQYNEDWKIRVSGQPQQEQHHDKIVNLAVDNNTPVQPLSHSDKRAALVSQVELVGFAPDQPVSQVEQARGRSNSGKKLASRRSNLAASIDGQAANEQFLAKEQAHPGEFSHDELYRRSNDMVQGQGMDKAKSNVDFADKDQAKKVGVNLKLEALPPKKGTNKPDLYAALPSVDHDAAIQLPKGELPQNTLSSRSLLQDVSSPRTLAQDTYFKDIALEDKYEIANGKKPNHQLNASLPYIVPSNANKELLQAKSSAGLQPTMSQEKEAGADGEMFEEKLFEKQTEAASEEADTKLSTMEDNQTTEQVSMEPFPLTPEPEVVELAIQEGLAGFDVNKKLAMEQNLALLNADQRDAKEQQLNSRIKKDEWQIKKQALALLSADQQNAETQRLNSSIMNEKQVMEQTLALMVKGQQSGEKQKLDFLLKSGAKKTDELVDLSSLGQGNNEKFSEHKRELSLGQNNEQLFREKKDELRESNFQMERIRKQLAKLSQELAFIPKDLYEVKQSQLQRTQSEDMLLFNQHLEGVNGLLSQAKDLSQRMQDLSWQLASDENGLSESLALRNKKSREISEDLKQKAKHPENDLALEEELRQQVLIKIDYFREELEPLFLLKEAQSETTPSLIQEQNDPEYKSRQNKESAIKDGEINKNEHQTSNGLTPGKKDKDLGKQLAKTLRENKKLNPQRTNDPTNDTQGRHRSDLISSNWESQVMSDVIAAPSPAREFPYYQQQSAPENEVHSPYPAGEEGLSHNEVFAKVIQRLGKHRENLTRSEEPAAPKVSVLNKVYEQASTQELEGQRIVSDVNLPERRNLTPYETKHPFQRRKQLETMSSFSVPGMNYLASRHKQANLWGEVPIKVPSNFSLGDFTTTIPATPRMRMIPGHGVLGGGHKNIAPVNRQIIPRAYKSIIQRLYQEAKK